MPSENAALIERTRAHVMNTYRPQPVVVTRGEGCWVWDADGRRYLDMTAGVAVASLGHAPPRVADALAAQARRLLHASNLVMHDGLAPLAEALAARTFDARLFLCNSGTEANECALKLARRYQVVVRGAPERLGIVAFAGSFHGRTSGALSLTGQPKHRDGFGPLVGPVRFAPFGDAKAVRAAIDEHTCAVFVEPIQGEGGVVVPSREFLRELRDACDATGTILVFDEVQTGVGRTGTFWAYEASGVVPDVLTSAKGLAGGVPIGAVLARPEIARAFEPGAHASTFGGNPLACAAALAVLGEIDARGLLENVRAMGARLGAGLERLARAHAPRALEARGIGLLRGLRVRGEAAPFVAACRERGVLVSAAGGDVIRLTPPLVVGREEIDAALAALDGALGDAR